MCSKRLVSRKIFIAIASVFYPVGVTIKSKTIVSNNFKLMYITATQMIAHYSVDFDWIHKCFTLLAFQYSGSGKISRP